MSKKKKEEEIFKPSVYQQQIFDFILNGNGNLLIEACAGSGKTKTLIEIMKLIDQDKKILYCAFNKDIVTEITKKINKKERENLDIRTIHSLGLTMLKNNLRDKQLIKNEHKYKTFLRENLKELSSINTYGLGKKFGNYMENILKLTDYFRFNLCQTGFDCEQLCLKYGIELIADEIHVVLQLIDWGKSYLDEIDFVDMIWLPNALNLQPYGLKYDYVLVDECQDLSAAQRELVLKCHNISTRYVFCGDDRQSIYGFASADSESFQKIKKIPNTTLLPLSISYRCDKRIVKIANTVAQKMEANPENGDGEVVYDAVLEEVKDGDMVLCRNNAPLMKLYNDFLKMGKKCFFKGKDIGLNLKQLVNSTHETELNRDLRKEGVFMSLYKRLFERRNEIMSREKLDIKDANECSYISDYLDQIRALEAISDGINTAEELITRIERMFSNKKEEGISLSSVHKAKGLEADNVYIACHSLMPSKHIKLPWEEKQESNLQYVAYTRAKHKLAFLNEKEFKSYTSGNTESLNSIEAIVNHFYGLHAHQNTQNDRRYAEAIIKRSTTPTVPTRGKNISLNSNNNIKINKSPLGILKRNKTKIKL